MPTRLLALVVTCATLVGALGAPSGAQPRPPICDAADALDPDHEVAASPRPIRNAELFAIAGSEGLAADDAMYELVARDLLAIDAVAPGIVDLPVHPRDVEETILVGFVDDAARDAARNGEIPTLECLFDLLDLAHAQYFHVLPSAAYTFDGIYDTGAIRALVETLPEVESTSPNTGTFGPTGCYYSPDGRRRVYFFSETDQLFFPPARWMRVEVGGTGIDVRRHEGVGPPWYDELEACFDGELEGTLGVFPSGLQDVPAASDAGLLALGLLVALAARRRLARRA